MTQENIELNEPGPGSGAAPFLYMQADQPPGGSGGQTPLNPDSPLDEESSNTSGTTTDETGPPPAGGTDDATTPADQPPGGSGG